MVDAIKKAIDTIGELRLAAFCLLLCFALLGAITWVGYEVGMRWVSMEGQRIEINRQQIENIKRLSDMIEQTAAADERQHQGSIKVLEELTKALEKSGGLP